MMHYLGPSVGKVPLSTWDQVVAAAEGGSLRETQWVELKEQLGPSNKSTNGELARDLASLSLHGGVLVFGVEDRTLDVVGCDVSGMVDRISQVAALRVHPPLTPVVYPPIVNPENTHRHVLVVEVPPSAQAPHMVDDSYWGRSANGKRKLSDPEVRQRMEARAGDEILFKARLLEMVAQDPLAPMIEGHPTGNGHIYLFAAPCATVLGRGEDFHLLTVLNGLFTQRNRGTPGSLVTGVGDALGPAAKSTLQHVVANRLEEDHLAYLLCNEDDWSLQFTSGNGTTWAKAGNWLSGRDEERSERVSWHTILESTYQFMRFIRVVSLNHWGYQGQWRVGIHVTNLANKPVGFDGQSGTVIFTRDSYTSTTVTEPASWSDDAEPETRELLAGFLRAIGRPNHRLDQLIQLD